MANPQDFMTHRFNALLQPRSYGLEPHDEPLMATPEWVVAPSLGAIVPNWLLIVPRSHALNFRDWRRSEGIEPIGLVDEVCQKLSLPRQRVIWFEHGPARRSTQVGCGLDHAHIHFLIDAPFSLSQVRDAAAAANKVAWQECPPTKVYEAINPARSYIALGSGDEAYLAENVEHTGSQFLRRVIADLINAPCSWDYREHPHHQNIRLSIETFRELAGAELNGR